MINNIRYKIKEYARQHNILIFMILLSFMIGTVTGVVSACFINREQSGEIESFVQNYCTGASSGAIEHLSMFIHSFVNNTRLLFVLWLCSLCYFFIPLVFCSLGIKGFGIGFTVSFLVRAFGGKGLALSLASIIPQGIFSMPAFFFVAMCAVRFAWDRSYKDSEKIKDFTYKCLICCVLLVAAGFADAFIAPEFIKSICRLF